MNKNIFYRLGFYSLVIVFSLMSTFSFAQDKKESKMSVFVHGLYGFSLESSSQKYYKSEIGGVAGVGYTINNTMPIASIGYSSFTPTKIKKSSSLTYIPFKVGARQLLPLQKTTLFGQADLGLAFLSADKNLPETAKKSDTRFAFDIGVGAKIGKGLETAIIWDNYKEKGKLGWASWVTLRVGWSINFK